MPYSVLLLAVLSRANAQHTPARSGFSYVNQRILMWNVDAEVSILFSQ
jgi:hypothetical protein